MVEYWVMGRDRVPISRHRTAWHAVQFAREFERKNPRQMVSIFRSKPIGRRRWNQELKSDAARWLSANTPFVSFECGYAPKKMT